MSIEHIAKSHIRKEDVVARALEQNGDYPGRVHIISAMEACDAYKPWHDKQTHKTFVKRDSGKCLHYYFYFMANNRRYALKMRHDGCAAGQGGWSCSPASRGRVAGRCGRRSSCSKVEAVNRTLARWLLGAARAEWGPRYDPSGATQLATEPQPEPD